MARIRFAWRSLAKAPLLSLTVVLSIGLGIGANTAIFSLFQQILLNTLPVERPQELVSIMAPEEFKGGRNSTDNSGDMNYIFSYPMFRELEKRPQGMSGIAAFRSLGANLSFRKQSITGGLLIVSGGYYQRSSWLCTVSLRRGPIHGGVEVVCFAYSLSVFPLVSMATSWSGALNLPRRSAGGVRALTASSLPVGSARR